VSRHTRKHGATLRGVSRARVTEEQSARLCCVHDIGTPKWAREAIDETWEGLRFAFAVDISSGEFLAALGAIVVDVDDMPGGRIIAPDGGRFGLAVGRAKMREFAVKWAGDEAVGLAVDVDPGPGAAWVFVALADFGHHLARVHLGVEGAPSAEATR
jgi:hypothetical protein